MRFAHRLYLIALALALPASSVLAQQWEQGSGAVIEARRLIKVELRYDDAIALLEPALLDAGLSAPLRIEAYELLGQASVAKGLIEKAEAAFVSLLELAPEHQLGPTVSPKIREVFERVKRRGPRAPRLMGLTASVAEHRLAFVATLDDPSSRVRSVDLFFRTLPDDRFRSIPMQIDDRALVASLDETLRGGTRIDYYVIARAKDGEPLARIGGPDSPSSVFVEGAGPSPVVTVVDVKHDTEDSTPLIRRWWFWAAVGGVLVAGIAAALVIANQDSSVPQGTLPPLDLTHR
jgi:hypothetical protein